MMDFAVDTEAFKSPTGGIRAAIAEQAPSPCEGCSLWEACQDVALACATFKDYVERGKPVTRPAEDLPDAETYALIFTE